MIVPNAVFLSGFVISGKFNQVSGKFNQVAPMESPSKVEKRCDWGVFSGPR